MTEMYRQGDVLFIRTEKEPSGKKRANGHILEGEMTGHVHRIVDLDAAEVLVSGDMMTIRVISKGGVDVVHEEHKPIHLPTGNYDVVRQREYLPKPIHNVKIHSVRGVRDILPPGTALWNRVEQIARDVFGSYGFADIRLPIFEQTELFVRSIGEETEIVSKEMFSLVDRSDGSGFSDGSGYGGGSGSGAGFGDGSGYGGPISTGSLRPEATASIVRADIEHGMHTLPGSVKLYCMGPMFRRERPQKGRYRQFYQIDAEVLGQSDAPSVDAEVIEMLMDYFARLQLAGTTLYVNSIGCKDCRPVYVEKLREALRAAKDQLGADSQRRIETNPLRVLDSKIPTEQAIIETLPRIADHLCAACREHFAALREELKLRQIAYEVNWRLVRGLDYYTRTTFEIIAPGLGSQNAVCGGGRYDGLVELLGGPPTKGIGFAIGLDRLILSLQEQGKGAVESGPDVFVAWMGEASWPLAVRIARQLRDAGIAVEVPSQEMKFRKALGMADKLGARYALIIGEDEVASQQFMLKRLVDGEQRKLSAEELLAHFHGELQRG
jgi:histidyl-tRNA synthetase